MFLTGHLEPVGRVGIETRKNLLQRKDTMTAHILTGILLVLEVSPEVLVSVFSSHRIILRISSLVEPCTNLLDPLDLNLTACRSLALPPTGASTPTRLPNSPVVGRLEVFPTRRSPVPPQSGQKMLTNYQWNNKGQYAEGGRMFPLFSTSAKEERAKATMGSHKTKVIIQLFLFEKDTEWGFPPSQIRFAHLFHCCTV